MHGAVAQHANVSLATTTGQQIHGAGGGTGRHGGGGGRRGRHGGGGGTMNGKHFTYRKQWHRLH